MLVKSCIDNNTNIAATYTYKILYITINEPIVKNPPVADDSYCYVCIFLKKSKYFKLIL